MQVMRKTTLLLSLIFMSFAPNDLIESKGAVERESPMVSEPKSNFCITSNTDDTLILKNYSDSIKIKEIESQKFREVDVDSVVERKMAKVQDDKGATTDELEKVAVKASEVAVGKITFYGHGDGFHGKRMANGNVFDKYALTSASPLVKIKGKYKAKYPFGTKLKVTNVENGKTVIVTITDTGGFGKKGLLLDLSYGAFKKIANPKVGVLNVTIEKVND